MTVKQLTPRLPITGIEVTATNQTEIIAFMREHCEPRDMHAFERKAAENPNWCYTIGSWLICESGRIRHFSRAETAQHFELDQSTTR